MIKSKVYTIPKFFYIHFVKIFCSLLRSLLVCASIQWRSQSFIGGGGKANAEGVRHLRGPGACTLGKILKSGVSEMRFQAFWG